MVLIKSPNMPPNNPFRMDPDERPAITLMPKMAIQNISEGPNLRAILARGGVNRIMTTMPNKPPTSELMKQ